MASAGQWRPQRKGWDDSWPLFTSTVELMCGRAALCLYSGRGRLGHSVLTVMSLSTPGYFYNSDRWSTEGGGGGGKEIER